MRAHWTPPDLVDTSNRVVTIRYYVEVSMTREDRKRYSREFKLEAVRRINESGKPVTELARELGISVHL